MTNGQFFNHEGISTFNSFDIKRVSSVLCRELSISVNILKLVKISQSNFNYNQAKHFRKSHVTSYIRITMPQTGVYFLSKISLQAYIHNSRVSTCFVIFLQSTRLTFLLSLCNAGNLQICQSQLHNGGIFAVMKTSSLCFICLNNLCRNSKFEYFLSILSINREKYTNNLGKLNCTPSSEYSAVKWFQGLKRCLESYFDS